MTWKKEETKVATEPKVQEGVWESSYPNSLDRWKKDFEVDGYKLTAEYDLGDGRALYRFEGEGRPHNVIIGSK